METYEIWLNIAEEDLIAAEWSYKGDQFLWTVFMCQQCIEKALKAIYIYKTKEMPPKKHDLIYLAQIIDVLNDLDDVTKQLLRYLNVYYIETRYTEKRTELKAKCNSQNTMEIMNQTKELLECLKNKLEK